ncbi:MAG: ABC transporter permease subunit [Candidatus Methanoperedens sp.]|nr:ABC transporter permease subunit [Candidatus Methanoperedens sp.]
MKRNVDNIFVIAQKEFADSVWSSRFYLILGIFMFIVLANSYQAGQSISGANFFGDYSPLSAGFISLSYPISLLGGLVAIGLGFDAIVKERTSGSLNVLLTHPVYRDQVITGKLIGVMVTLGLVTVISVGASTGVMLSVSGIIVSTEVIGRIIVFILLAFLVMLSYLSLSVAVSVFTKESTNSLIYSATAWLALSVLLGMVASTIAGVIIGQSTYSEDAYSYEKKYKITRDIMYLSPSTDFMELITGLAGMPGGDRTPEMRGLFDTGFTLGYWVEQNWVNLIMLLIIPVILLLVSYMAFMRQDITV